MVASSGGSILTAVFVFVIHKTRYGNWIYAMGGDIVARNAGVPTSRLTIALFMLSAMSARPFSACAVRSSSTRPRCRVEWGTSSMPPSSVWLWAGVLFDRWLRSVVGIFFGTMTFAIVSQGIYFTDMPDRVVETDHRRDAVSAVAMNESFRKLALSSGSGKRRRGGANGAAPAE